jgi:hypothetical protein
VTSAGRAAALAGMVGPAPRVPRLLAWLTFARCEIALGVGLAGAGDDAAAEPDPSASPAKATTAVTAAVANFLAPELIRLECFYDGDETA